MGSFWGEAPLLKLENTPSPLHLLADSQFLYLVNLVFCRDGD